MARNTKNPFATTSTPTQTEPDTASTGFNRNTGSIRTINPPRSKPAHDQIAKRAYEIWVSKGRPVGRDQENWQQAERELSAGTGR